MVTLTWSNAPYRVDDEAYKAKHGTRTLTLTCDEQPVLIIESPLQAEKQKPEAA
jgi:hypothetical protein